MKIPLLGVQTLNSISNLKNLILSVDYPVEVLSIVINNENFDFVSKVKNFCDNLDNNFISKIDISWHPSNLGCAASWNYHFKQYPFCDFFVKSDDDVVFEPGTLKKMVEDYLSNDSMVFATNHTRYCCFLIPKRVLNKVGLFDENYWPANYEDDDYLIRLNRCNEKTFTIGDNSIKHLSSGSSRNLNSDKELRLLQNFLVETESYFYKKWGGGYPNSFSHPFNNNKIDYKSIDYSFMYRENKIFRCNYYV
jgi:GT2 family glycosyltransferase